MSVLVIFAYDVTGSVSACLQKADLCGPLQKKHGGVKAVFVANVALVGRMWGFGTPFLSRFFEL